MCPIEHYLGKLSTKNCCSRFQNLFQCICLVNRIDCKLHLQHINYHLNYPIHQNNMPGKKTLLAAKSSAKDFFLTSTLLGIAYKVDMVSRFCSGVGVNSDTPSATCLQNKIQRKHLDAQNKQTACTQCLQAKGYRCNKVILEA